MVITDTEWHHIAYTYDGVTRAGYIDGSVMATSDLQFVLRVFDSSWFIGAANPSVNHVAGDFDDVRIYNYGLSAGEIEDLVTGELPQGVSYVRGDTNADGEVNITDPVFSLNFQFGGGPTPSCLAAADSNGDGDFSITDPVFSLNFQFGGGPPLPPPAACGEEPRADEQECLSFPRCE